MRHLHIPKEKRAFALKIKMTLDRVSLHTIKGHFCSLLVSNILCDPLFLLIPFRYLTVSPVKLVFSDLSRESALVFPDTVL